MSAASAPGHPVEDLVDRKLIPNQRISCSGGSGSPWQPCDGAALGAPLMSMFLAVKDYVARRKPSKMNLPARRPWRSRFGRIVAFLYAAPSPLTQVYHRAATRSGMFR